MRLIRLLSFAVPRILIASVAMLALLALGNVAEAQLKNSGRHPYYGFELEPRLVWQWTGDEWSWEDGIGLGLRISIPIIEDGPVKTINNNLAITFGLDWAYFDGECGRGNVRVDCDENDFWVPIALQWNFFVSEAVSLFPELGLGFRDAIRSDNLCNVPGCDDTDLEVHLALWFGARFMVADRIALTMRLGTPSLLFGASFLL
jgi:hypothetical protein